MSQTATQETGSKEEQRAEGNGEVKTDGEGDPLPSVLIAAVKENKIDGQAQSQSQSQSQQKGEQPASGSGSGSGTDDQARAALLIQRNYRGYRSRRELEGLSISADNRWTDAVTRARLDTANKQAGGGKNDATSRWRRGGLLVGQLAGSGPTGASTSDGAQGDGPVEGGPSVGPDAGNDDEDEDGADAGAGAPPDREKDKTKGMVGQVPGSNEGGKLDNVRTIAKPNQRGLKAIERWTHGQQAQELSKVMEGQYWLEMVDSKHRYGSNLKYYHEAWTKGDTNDNFFKWLDEGEGKSLDLPECDRARLDSERITYLSAEQRRNYVVDIKDGKLYWRRNGKPVDTTRHKHKDAGHGQGIVELGPEEQAAEAERKRQNALARGASRSSVESGSSSSSSSSSSSDDETDKAEQKEQAKHYGAQQKGAKKHMAVLTPKGWTDVLLRKTVQANTWIYVLNARDELYIGIKQTGKFQHSSFLYGGRVLSAGLIKVKDGTLTSLSPLSGHYRAGTAHFRNFIVKLQDQNLDLSNVTLSKSLLLLKGMETYGNLMKKTKGGNKKASEKKDANMKKENAGVECAADSEGREGEGSTVPPAQKEGKKGLMERLGLKKRRDGREEEEEEEEKKEGKWARIKDGLTPGHAKSSETPAAAASA